MYHKGWIDQLNVIEIPSLFNTEFAVAQGISGASTADWSDYKLMYEYSVRHINFNSTGYRGSSYLLALIVVWVHHNI